MTYKATARHLEALQLMQLILGVARLVNVLKVRIFLISQVLERQLRPFRFIDSQTFPLCVFPFENKVERCARRHAN